MTRTEIQLRSAIRASAIAWFRAPLECPEASQARADCVRLCALTRDFRIIRDAIHGACLRNKSADESAVIDFIFRALTRWVKR